MPRYTKILLGPARKNDPQVFEAVAAEDNILPGTLVSVNDAGEFEPANATSGLVHIAQENYLALRGVDVPYKQGDRLIGIEMQDDVMYAARIAAGGAVKRGDPLGPDANGFVTVVARESAVCFADETYTNDTSDDQLVSIRPR